MLVAGFTDKGRERSRNEDKYLVLSGKEAALLAVADGMGGHQAGNVASSLAVQVLESFWEEFDPSENISQDRLAEIVQNLVLEANRKIMDEASTDEAKNGMGTTLTVAMIKDGSAVIGHVGDSRAYAIKGGQISHLTQDHSLLQQMLQQGSISPEDAEGHPQRHILTRALGVDPGVKVDLAKFKMEEESILLLCSDGLTSLVADEEILKVVDKNDSDLESKASTLVDMANKRGGYDNITVVLAADIRRQA